MCEEDLKYSLLVSCLYGLRVDKITIFYVIILQLRMETRNKKRKELRDISIK